MVHLRTAATVAAAALCVALGVVTALQVPPPQGRQPEWAPSLAPVVEAPVPAGARVALVASRRTRGDPAGGAVLYEAAWCRPDLRFSWLDQWPRTAPAPVWLIAVASAPSEPGWRPVWRSGAVTLYSRVDR